jgi:hypothetical protein
VRRTGDAQLLAKYPVHLVPNSKGLP